MAQSPRLTLPAGVARPLPRQIGREEYRAVRLATPRRPAAGRDPQLPEGGRPTARYPRRNAVPLSDGTASPVAWGIARKCRKWGAGSCWENLEYGEPLSPFAPRPVAPRPPRSRGGKISAARQRHQRVRPPLRDKVDQLMPVGLIQHIGGDRNT